jgi:microcystin-dependent protein
MTVAGTLNVTGNLQLDGASGTSGQVMVSAGSGSTPTWGSGFPSGGIIIWSGAANAIPSGWLLCDGTNSTPNLRDRFVVGAGSTYAVGATGGSADAIVVSHTHTATTTATDSGHTHLSNAMGLINGTINFTGTGGTPYNNGNNTNTASSTANITATTTIDTAGASGTNANLPPYYALCYIMKS